MNELNVKLNEEKSKNQKLIIELRELHLKNQRLIEDKKKIPKSEKELVKMNSGLITSKNKLFQSNKSFEFKNDVEEGTINHATTIDPRKSSKKLRLDKNKNESDINSAEDKFIFKKYTKTSSKVIKEITEDNISISESSSEDKDNEKEKENEKDNENEILSSQKGSRPSLVVIKEKLELGGNSSSISEDNPELYKEVDKIMNNNNNNISNNNNNNNNHIQNDNNEKNHEKTNSSFKDDKSTKMEIDKNTYMQSYSET